MFFILYNAELQMVPALSTESVYVMIGMIILKKRISGFFRLTQTVERMHECCQMSLITHLAKF